MKACRGIAEATLFCVGATALIVCAAASAEDGAGGDGAPLRILILSGQNNHDWRTTTPAIRQALDQTGRFAVEVTEAPERMTSASFASFDAVISNWNAWGDAAVTEWPAAAREALIAFVRSGKGYVTVHAGGSSFYDWPEYHALALAAWDLSQTGHGALHAFPVAFTEVDHPITRGLRPFVIFDELWHRTGIRDDAQTLAAAWSSAERGGSGRDEPVLVAAPFGEGRSVALLLGHDARALANPSCAALLARSAEWAATGSVTIDPPRTGWERTDGDLARYENGELLWRFRASPELATCYFDPLRPAGGPSLTWDAPPDHIWHHGLWFSWKYLNGLNYWESPESGLNEGLTAWEPPEFTLRDDGSATIRIAVRYVDPSGVTVLTEDREIAVSALDRFGGFTLDWHAAFTPGAGDVLLDRTPVCGEPDGVAWGGYAGLSLRMPDLADPRITTESGPAEAPDGMGPIEAEAMDYSGVVEGRRAGVAMTASPEHPVHPPTWYAIQQPEVPFYFFSPALLYRAPMHLAAGERLEIRNFGVFEIKIRDARIGRNPRTGAEVPIAEKRVAVFKPGKALKALVERQPPEQEGAPRSDQAGMAPAR